MKITDIIYDAKVQSKIVQFKINIEDYCKIAEKIISQNTFQRKKVSNSKTVYSLLKDDISKGCLMPAIVLSSKQELSINSTDQDADLSAFIEKNIGSINILDGLQRTFTILEAFSEYKDHLIRANYQVRIEMYVGISDVNILYRMLTLNTGQTPMTLRHQIEILYAGYITHGIEGMRVLREVETQPLNSSSDFRFSDLIDGYTSFIEGNELPLDRADLLSIIKVIDFIAIGRESTGFVDFCKNYSLISTKFDAIFAGIDYSKSNSAGSDSLLPEHPEIPEQYRIESNPFGDKSFKIFNKSQALTGFGSAIYWILQKPSAGEVYQIINNEINLISDDPFDDFCRIIKALDEIKNESKKIGNGQRIFFKYFFRYLLNPIENEHHLRISTSIEQAKIRALNEI